MPRYQEKYSIGTAIRIASREALNDFYANWKYHNKLTLDQLEFAGDVAEVKSVTFYHGGDVLYELEGIPGVWHEECLRDFYDSSDAS